MAPKGSLVGGLIAQLQQKDDKHTHRQLAAPPAIDAEAACLEYASRTLVQCDGDGLSAATPRSTHSTHSTCSGEDGFLTARTATDAGSINGSFTSRTSAATSSDGFMTARTTSSTESAMTDCRYKTEGEGGREGRATRRKHRRPSMSLSPSLIGSVCSDDDGSRTQRSMLSDGSVTDRSHGSATSGHRTHRSAEGRKHRSKSRGPGGKRDRSRSAALNSARGEGEGGRNMDFYVVPEEETPKVAAAQKFKQEAMAENRASDLEARLFSSGLTPKMANMGRFSSPRAAKSPRVANNGFTSITPTNNIFRNAMMMHEAVSNPDLVKKGFKAVAAAAPTAATPTGVGCMMNLRGVPQSPTTPKVRGCGIRMPFKLMRSSSKLLK